MKQKTPDDDFVIDQIVARYPEYQDVGEEQRLIIEEAFARDQLNEDMLEYAGGVVRDAAPTSDQAERLRARLFNRQVQSDRQTQALEEATLDDASTTTKYGNVGTLFSRRETNDAEQDLPVIQPNQSDISWSDAVKNITNFRGLIFAMQEDPQIKKNPHAYLLRDISEIFDSIDTFKNDNPAASAQHPSVSFMIDRAMHLLSYIFDAETSKILRRKIVHLTDRSVAPPIFGIGDDDSVEGVAIKEGIHKKTSRVEKSDATVVASHSMTAAAVPKFSVTRPVSQAPAGTFTRVAPIPSVGQTIQIPRASGTDEFVTPTIQQQSPTLRRIRRPKSIQPSTSSEMVITPQSGTASPSTAPRQSASRPTAKQASAHVVQQVSPEDVLQSIPTGSAESRPSSTSTTPTSSTRSAPVGSSSAGTSSISPTSRPMKQGVASDQSGKGTSGEAGQDSTASRPRVITGSGTTRTQQEGAGDGEEREQPGTARYLNSAAPLYSSHAKRVFNKATGIVKDGLQHMVPLSARNQFAGQGAMGAGPQVGPGAIGTPLSSRVLAARSGSPATDQASYGSLGSFGPFGSIDEHGFMRPVQPSPGEQDEYVSSKGSEWGRHMRKVRDRMKKIERNASQMKQLAQAKQLLKAAKSFRNIFSLIGGLMSKTGIGIVWTLLQWNAQILYGDWGGGKYKEWVKWGWPAILIPLGFDALILALLALAIMILVVAAWVISDPVGAGLQIGCLALAITSGGGFGGVRDFVCGG